MLPIHDASEETSEETSEQVRDHPDERVAETAIPPRPMTEPLSALEARMANAEAVERGLETSESMSEARRRGRIEAETRRISEEATHRAQERTRAEQARAKQPAPVRPTAAASTLRPFPGTFPFTRILVPLDGTFYAERALPYAAGLARLTGASMVLGHVSQPALPAPARVARQVAEDIVSREHEPHERDFASYLNAHRVLQAFHVPAVTAETLEDGDAIFGLRQLAERTHADAMVLATHARQGIERQVLGSRVDGLVEQSHLPLLIVPPQVVVPAEAPSFKHVLVPLDGSAVGEYALGVLMGLIQAAIRPGAAHAEFPSWHVTLFTVVQHRALTRQSRDYLGEVEARLRATGLPASVRIAKRVLLGSPPGALVAVAEHGRHSPDDVSAPFDLVVMATHGRGGLGAWLYGSVARYVLPRVAVPVLLVHPTDVSM
jgi:nucleotide-binding universal stress UspA family protein